MKNTYKGYSQELTLPTNSFGTSLRAFSAYSHVNKYAILAQASSFGTALASPAILICTFHQLSEGDSY